MPTYFDGVLDKSLDVVFNGTPEETRAFLLANQEHVEDFLVCAGEALKIFTGPQYLERGTDAQAEDHQS